MLFLVIVLLLQIAALEWIKKEIPKFGGDETKITVFGSGAGAASIHYLLLCKQCKGLFQRAILQSGSAYNPWAMQYQPKNVCMYYYLIICTKNLKKIFIDVIILESE